MSPEAEEVCSRAIEAGACDPQVVTFWRSPGYSREELKALTEADAILEALCGARENLREQREQKDPGYFYTSAVMQAFEKRIDATEES